MKISSDTNENRTRDLPTCCAEPQPPTGYHRIQDEPNAEGIFTACSLILLFSLVTQASPFSLKCVIKMEGSSLRVTQLRDLIQTDSTMNRMSYLIFSHP
jgi:hypothetical protein